MTQCDTVWHSVTQCDTVWHSVTQCDAVWHSVRATVYFFVYHIHIYINSLKELHTLPSASMTTPRWFVGSNLRSVSFLWPPEKLALSLSFARTGIGAGKSFLGAGDGLLRLANSEDLNVWSFSISIWMYWKYLLRSVEKDFSDVQILQIWLYVSIWGGFG